MAQGTEQKMHWHGRGLLILWFPFSLPPVMLILILLNTDELSAGFKIIR